MICPYMSGIKFDFRRCQEKDCKFFDKDKLECNDVLERKALESIAKSLDRLHNSQIKPSIKGD